MPCSVKYKKWRFLNFSLPEFWGLTFRAVDCDDGLSDPLEDSVDCDEDLSDALDDWELVEDIASTTSSGS